MNLIQSIAAAGIALAIQGSVCAQEKAPDVSITQHLSGLAETPESLRELVRGPIRITVRRYHGIKAGDEAYERVERALNDLARAKGVNIAESSDSNAIVLE